MKRLMLLTAVTMLISLSASAQQFTYKPKGNIADTKVVLRNLFADIIVEGTADSEILISTNDYEGIPDRAKGLKPLSATGPENTGIGLSVIQEGNEIIISAASRNADDSEYTIRLPKNIKLQADLNTWQAGDFYVKGMTNEVEAKSQSSDMVFVDVTGPIIAHSLSSDIEVVFTTLNQSTPSSISSTSGDIDITIPASTKGNFHMSSVSGEVYTDLDFEFSNEKDLKRFGGGMSAKANLNGGGVEISLKSVSGDVFIRKGK